MALREILLPTTNGGVLIQTIGVLVVGGMAMVWLRHSADARLVAIGATLLGLGLIGIRALH
ncbi:hypothetical protein BH23ACT5_BH23ACT5_16020 [soil metagenome]